MGGRERGTVVKGVRERCAGRSHSGGQSLRGVVYHYCKEG